MDSNVKSSKDGRMEKGPAMDTEKDKFLLGKTKGMENEVFTTETSEQVDAGEKGDRKVEREVFRRKPMLARTPPQRRAMSLPGDEEEARERQRGREVMEDEKVKRKRGEESPTATTGKETKKAREVRAEPPLSSQRRTSEVGAAQIRGVIKQIIGETRIVVEAAKERNTKKEVKEAAAKLSDLIAQLLTVESQELLQSLGKNTDESVGRLQIEWQARLVKVEDEIRHLKEINQEVQKENKRLKAKNEVLGQENVKLRARLDKGAGREEAITPEMIAECKTMEDFQGLVNKRWPDKLYTAVFPAAGSFMGANADTDLLLLEEEGPDASKNAGIRRALEERYPEIKETTEILAATILTSYRDGQGVRKTNERWVLKAAVGDDLFSQLLHIKQVMAEQGRKKLAVYPPGNDPTGEVMRKRLECVFRGSSVKCLLYRKHTRGETAVRGNNATEEGDSSRGGTGSSRAQRPEVLVVSQEGKSYSEILRDVKDKVKPHTQAAKAIRNIRESRDKSKLVIVLNKNEEGAREELVKEIKGLEAVRVRERVDQDMDTILLTGMDGITTREEVLEAVCEATGIERGLVLVGEPRKAYGGNQTVSVRLPRTEAMKLQKVERIRIGLNLCLIKERVDVVRCFRCWQYGHLGRECKAETDQSQCCWKCGDGRHKAVDCTLQPRCLTCKAVGHTAGSGACPEFRKALSRERKSRKKKRGY